MPDPIGRPYAIPLPPATPNQMPGPILDTALTVRHGPAYIEDHNQSSELNRFAGVNDMKSTGRKHISYSRALRTIALASVLLILAACNPTKPPGNPPPTTVDQQRQFQKDIAKVPPPKKGCFEATYPNREWHEVPCKPAPPYPYLPRHGARADVVGNTNDVSAQAPTGFISNAIGTFDSVTGVTSESGQIDGQGPQVTNAYSLQVNTNPFSSPACAGSPNAGCQGWEQFVFGNDGSSGSAVIQYWLLKYDAPCPAGAGWTQFQFKNDPDIYCYKNDSNEAAPVPNQPITDLSQMSLSGTVTTGGDNVVFSSGGHAYTKVGDNTVKAAAGWKAAEFNVFGDAGGGQANLNSGSALAVKTEITYGGTAAPTCLAQGFTGETNNLSFGPTSPASAQPGPAVEFAESSAGGAPSDCAAATTLGDTHLATFSGLLYDFQAQGDFIVAQAGPDFTVQARQVSGAPMWPNAAVNHAIATQMGKTRVALCVEPERLAVDGKPTNLPDGKTLSLPSGVDVRHTGDAYTVTDQGGNSIHAVMNPSWINVNVGLGAWPADVHGLLANRNGNVDELETSQRTVVESPRNFSDLYRYGETWRVPPNASLLSDCGTEPEYRIPAAPFFAQDLEPSLRDRAQATCTQAGIKEPALLDACTLDVAVIGDEKAAHVYVGKPTPVKVLPRPR